jgi:hypothetical protein
MTKKCTIISQIITLLHVSTLSCHPRTACRNVIICEIIVHLLVIEQNNKRCMVQGIKIIDHSFVSLQLLYVIGKECKIFWCT